MNKPVSTTNVDAIALEIQWQRLIAIMDEVDNATVRTSFSTIVGESRDFACILVDQDGSSLCQSSFSPPNFCVVLPRTTRALLDVYPLETLREGDVAGHQRSLAGHRPSPRLCGDYPSLSAGQTGSLHGHGRAPRGRRRPPWGCRGL